MSRVQILGRKSKKLPTSPGVYFFKNKSGEIIYIGKAGNLKNRVRSYFSSLNRLGSAKVKMVSEIAAIEIIKTASEIEALVKESELIKKHKPKFNVLMRDSKNYLFIGFTKDKFPRAVLTHQITNYKLPITNFIGPFTDSGAVRKSLHLLRDAFPYCTCQQKHATKCLNAHMGRCLGICCFKNPAQNFPISCDRIFLETIYKKNIQAIKSVFSGKSQAVLKLLKKEIKQHIKTQNFEQAKELKNQIAGLKDILNHARVLTDKLEVSPAIFKDTLPNFKLLGFKNNPQRLETYDISNIQGQEAVGSMVVFEHQADGSYKPNKSEYRKFKIKTVTGINDPAMLAEVIRRRLNHSEWPQPQLIIVDGGKTQLNAAQQALGRKKIKLMALAKRLEEIYLPGKKDPFLAQSLGQALKRLFQAIRDEAHRFALNYHRKLHQKTLIS